jgi:hypothetical protein
VELDFWLFWLLLFFALLDALFGVPAALITQARRWMLLVDAYFLFFFPFFRFVTPLGDLAAIGVGWGPL